MQATLRSTALALLFSASLTACRSHAHGPNPSAASSENDAHIARITSGLAPAVVIAGQPDAHMQLADRMQHYHVPGVSIAFFDHSGILWTRAYGLADVASNRPVTPDTLFQAASISKPVSAMAALHLVEQGKLSLDADVNTELKSWKVPDNQFTREQKVTLRRMLSHSAGLTVHGFAGYAKGEPLPTTVQILDGAKPANSDPIRVDTVPGTIWRYSGGGYVILQLLMSDVTGQAYPDIMQQLVLGPAGMTHSTYQQPLPKDKWGTEATPYRDDGKPVEGGWHTYPEMAPAGLWTTPSDLARIAIEVQKEYNGESNKILSQSMAHQMLTVQKGQYGLGWGLNAPGEPLRFGHNGGNEGFRCVLQSYIGSGGQGVAIMTNGDGGGDLMGEILRAVATEYGWTDLKPEKRTLGTLDPKQVPQLAGEYDAPGSHFTVAAADGGLTISSNHFPGTPKLLPESDGRFFMKDQPFHFRFDRDAKGNVTGLSVMDGDHVFDQAKRKK
jgi:CubicO group peptidase (beta-lactamase class C family)